MNEPDRAMSGGAWEPHAARSAGRRSQLPLVLLLAAATLLSSCAYFNTFYLARKYYFRATAGAPYGVEAGNSSAAQNLNKSIDLSKKLLVQYSKSKWVDDAYLLWARALLARDDPQETVNMLQDFATRFPRSPLRTEVLFYLGVGYRQARRYGDAASTLEEFLRRAPRHELAPYAHLERARALMSLDHPKEAAEAAGQVIERFPGSDLADRARAARAEARFAQRAYDLARADYRAMGARSTTDEQRFGFLLREADCLEAARQFPEEQALLRDALAHEREPLPPDTTGGKPLVAPTGPGADHWGRLMLRVGSAHMLAGRLDEALAAFQRVVADYPKSALAAEALYRTGFAYETVADDFEKARAEYARVKDHTSGGPFLTQAGERLASLDRLAQYRSAGGDTLQKRAEAGFLLAEVYLFQLEKPERALEQYRKIADDFTGTPWAAKALNAQGWVLSRKLDRPAESDSLFWKVVREYPATEEQLAARDYLELAGATVPDTLIKLPPPRVVPADTARILTPPPAAAAPLGTPQRGLFAPAPDSLRLGPRGPSAPPPPAAPTADSLHPGPGLPPVAVVSPPIAPAPDLPPPVLRPPAPAPVRSIPWPGTILIPAPPDSSWMPRRPATARPDTARVGAARPDTARGGAARPDTARSAAQRDTSGARR